ncbi:MAG: ArsR family transcriptional regulator [Bacteroidetes bacterium]|nr:ArsR family transcriptional regulator [Bacteroidota bacterium]MBL6944394.1 ArsR family transcriptional regulator [Bacteroidales bacterium]
MLEALITSKTRVKLLLKFFLNSSNISYLRGLEPAFGESTNAIRQELNRFEEADLLISSTKGNKKLYRANTNHPLFPEIHKLLLKHVGLDKVIDKVIHNIGDIKEVYLVGELAKGNNSKVIDLWFVGKKLDSSYILNLAEKLEEIVHRKIRYIILNTNELSDFKATKNSDELLLLWKAE